MSAPHDSVKTLQMNEKSYQSLPKMCPEPFLVNYENFTKIFTAVFEKHARGQLVERIPPPHTSNEQQVH